MLKKIVKQVVNASFFWLVNWGR